MKIIKAAGISPHQESLVQASALIPDWYKKIKLTPHGGKPVLRSDGQKDLTVKACAPFLDSLTSGYMITLQQDIQVSIVDGKEYFAWPTSPTPMGGRGETSLIPAPEGYSPTDLFWITNNVIELPSGYSLLVTHPNNRFDLPFLTLSGIVDADGLMTSGRLPFFIKSGFSGVIPKGTPICQILPFKREAWRLLEDPALVEKNHKNSWLSSSVVFGWYKRSIWQRKIYD